MASSGNVTDEVIKAYIQNQDLPEKSNSEDYVWASGYEDGRRKALSFLK